MSTPARVASPTRLLPLRVYVRGPARMVERSLIVYRKTWYVILSGFFEPVFYLLSIGLGLGTVVGDLDVAGRPVRYAAFVAPALLATSAMNGALFDSTGNVLFKLKFTKLYDTALTAPRTLADVALGEISWATLRGLLYTLGFLVVMVATGLTRSWWVLAAVPAAVLMGAAFAAVGMTGTTFMRGFADLELMLLIQLPLFLFSATFYPIGAYPRWLQVVVQCLPTYHGVDLVRSLSLGHAHIGLLGHVAYLLAMLGIGLVGISRRLAKLLLH